MARSKKHNRSRKRALALEQLEPRALLSNVPVALGPAKLDPRNLTPVGNELYFTSGGNLWKTDGTTTGTVKFSNFRLGIHYGTTYEPSLVSMADVNGILFFSAFDEQHGNELWKTDGTEAGTVLVKDINPGFFNYLGNISGYGSEPLGLMNINGTLFFSANDGTHFRELWKSDGTEAGTVMVKNIQPDIYGNRDDSSYPYDFANVSGTLFFTVESSAFYEAIWKSDGTQAGTVLVKDGFIRNIYGPPIDFTNVNGTVFFSALDGLNGRELWRTDGTTAGTEMVKDIYPGTPVGPYGGRYPANSYPTYLTATNGKLLFAASDSDHGNELWESDGTAAGTVLVKDIRTDINPYSGSATFSYPRYLTVVNGLVFFSADDGVHGKELWRSDGTTAGTMLVKDIDPTILEFGGTKYAIGSEPTNLTAINGKLYFSATDGVHGRELWESDGTNAGTELVADLIPGGIGSHPGTHGNDGYISDIVDFATANGTLYFSALNSANGQQLWAFTPDPVEGDVNQDGRRNSADFTALMTALTNPTANQSNGTANVADVNHDGSVDNLDMQALLSLLIDDATAGSGATKLPDATKAVSVPVVPIAAEPNSQPSDPIEIQIDATSSFDNSTQETLIDTPPEISSQIVPSNRTSVQAAVAIGFSPPAGDVFNIPSERSTVSSQHESENVSRQVEPAVKTQWFEITASALSDPIADIKWRLERDLPDDIDTTMFCLKTGRLWANR